MAHFERLELNNWRQFEAIDIRFGTQTTVVTGANGCGKTSILTVLGHHFGWNLHSCLRHTYHGEREGFCIANSESATRSRWNARALQVFQRTLMNLRRQIKALKV
ncbi:MAG: AAA family ATPase [Proteobacteria bacterium]|nr:AAA family ATPase [Pseudomonadota bacterium]